MISRSSKFSFKSSIYNNWTLIFFLLLPVFYCYLYAPYGLEDEDTGFITALCWRIFNGQIPYKDFIYIRPPITIYFHSIIFQLIPANYYIIFERCFFYFIVWIYSFLASLIISAFYDLQKMKLDKYLLSSSFFTFSCHNFPPMAWPSVDGVFFACLGAYFLSRQPRFYNTILSILFFVLSSLTKQSFFIMPIVPLLYLLLNYKLYKISNLIFAILTLFLSASILFMFLYKYSIVNSFITETTGQTGLYDLFSTAILQYLGSNYMFAISLILFYIFTRRFFKINIGWFGLLYIISLLGLICARSLYHQCNIYPREYSQFLFLICLVIIIKEFTIKNRSIHILLVLLSISWCASISRGYPLPVLFSPPLLFGTYLYLSKYSSFKYLNIFNFLILLFSLVTFFIAYQYPYRYQERKFMEYDISHVFPKLKYIKVQKKTYDKYSELKFIGNQYNDKFAILPSMPLSFYLLNKQNPLPVDWATNIEDNYDNENLINILESKIEYVLLEKNNITFTGTCSFKNHSTDKDCSVLYTYVKENWVLIKTYEYFDIYRRP